MTYVLANLECGHQADASIAEVQILQTFCYSVDCRRPRGILCIVLREWMVHCYDCNYKRYYGNNQVEALAAANRHYRRNNSHRAEAKKGPRPGAMKAQIMVVKRIGVAR
jgi:hypothetical protein